MDALDTFHPNRMADRILGMGDVVSLVEKRSKSSVKEAAQLEAKIRKQVRPGGFHESGQQLKKMGNIKDQWAIPGMSKALKALNWMTIPSSK